MHTLNANTLWILLLISIIGIGGKMIGAGIGAKAGGMTSLESLQLGIGMVSRGEVGLIVANVGLSQGLLNNDIFSSIVGMVLLTTLVTPPMLRASFSARKKKPSVTQDAVSD
jgi:Kef-type K+ transport system membrane component KefB